ncbi:hypothetical protein SAMN00777080_1635 [Aquiflexum balticum DSM 16537]|uniref:Uncharacterized protein n=1 Tax=Aquiflexum balticum DSM 16537 TaxID=758820 RepID=A0A1W2H2G0_9BACT|nr:hypothetical protein SAMN00777080_1635 [Aquiflexum balticum DSM 16537]
MKLEQSEGPESEVIRDVMEIRLKSKIPRPYGIRDKLK